VKKRGSLGGPRGVVPDGGRPLVDFPGRGERTPDSLQKVQKIHLRVVFRRAPHRVKGSLGAGTGNNTLGPPRAHAGLAAGRGRAQERGKILQAAVFFRLFLFIYLLLIPRC